MVLAANQVLLQFLEITAYALDGFAFAAEALVGVGVGAANRTAVRQGGWVASQWGGGGRGGAGPAVRLAGPWLIDLQTTSEEVRLAARDYLPLDGGRPR